MTKSSSARSLRKNSSKYLPNPCSSPTSSTLTKYLSASPLQPAATAAVVRVREGKPFVTDGPFVETREQVAGYFLIHAKDRDEAIAIATRVPCARIGTIEVRPVIEISGLPNA